VEIISVIPTILKKYLIDPILYGGGYNPVNTIVLAVGFYLFVLLMFRLTKWVKLPMMHLLTSFFPYMLLGGVIRSLVDVGVYRRSPLDVTPGIYLSVVSLFWFAYLVERVGKSPGLARNSGWVLLALNLLLLQKLDFWAVFTIAVIFAATALVVIFIASRLFKFIKNDITGQQALAAHLFEATSTSVAIQFYGFSEQHVLSRSLISYFGTPWIVFALKLVVIILALWLCSGLKEDEGLFVKTFIIALGIGPGLRNTLTCAMVAAG